jgi:Tfp pilus assembly protein PilN
MIRINLLPAKVRKTKGAQRIYTYAILGGSALVILLILLLLNLLSLTKRTETKIAKTDAAAAQLTETIRYLHDLTAREQYADRLRGTIRQLLPQQAVWIAVLDELANLMREDLWLTLLQVKPAPASALLRLDLEGEAYSKISVADFLSALENSERFRDVQLEALTDTQTATHTQVKFKIQLSCRNDEGNGGNTR